jgi:low affinity Fe/Cu permease
MPSPSDRCGILERLSQYATRAAGSAGAFVIAAGIILVWALLGPIFHFSDTWQLVINTGTTIVTFLMVFLIQRSQNKDALAIQLKLNEIIAALPKANNQLIDAEDLDERELRLLHKHFQELADIASRRLPLDRSHSVEGALRRAGEKTIA